MHLICMAYLTGLQLTLSHADKRLCRHVCANDPSEGGPQSEPTRQSRPSSKTRPQSDHSDAGRCRWHFSGMDDQLNKAMVTSCTRPDRENSKCFQETVLERFRLIACKSCTMNVKLHQHHINELSEVWSEFPQKRTFPLSQNSSCFV